MIHTFSGMVNVSVVPELGGRGATGPPPSIFGRSVNPIPNGVGRLCPPLPLAPPPKFFTFRHHWAWFSLNLVIAACISNDRSRWVDASLDFFKYWKWAWFEILLLYSFQRAFFLLYACIWLPILLLWHQKVWTFSGFESEHKVSSESAISPTAAAAQEAIHQLFGIAHHMFSRFLNLQKICYEIFFVLFFYEVEVFDWHQNT